MDKPTPPAPFTYVKRAATELPLVFLSEAIEHGNAMAAWGAAQERARMQEQIDDLISHLDDATTHVKTIVAENAMPDCRICRYKISDGCISTAQCVEGNLYRHTAPVRYWAKQGD